MGRWSAAVGNLVIANVLVFLATGVLPNFPLPLGDWLALWYPLSPSFGIWQFVTYMFVHGGLTHIFFNMFALISFGVVLERLWGARRFLIFYLICGVGAAVIHTLVQWAEFQSIQNHLVQAGMPLDAIHGALKTGQYAAVFDDNPAIHGLMVQLYTIYASQTVGASGAIYGILVAFALIYPNAGLSLIFLPVPIPAKYFVPGILALDMLGGVTGFSIFGGNIAHFAHIGGAIIGALLMWAWRDRGTGGRRERDV